jgi:hypothetical protein
MGSYPRPYNPTADFALEDQQGEPVDGTKLATELANIRETLSQVILFIKSGFTASKAWKPTEAVAQELLDQFTYLATSGQTTFVYTGGFELGPGDHVRVFSDGLLIDPADVTASTTQVVIPAQTAGAIVVVEPYGGTSSILAKLADNGADLGASLIAIENALGLFASGNVEDALNEVRTAQNNIQTLLGDLSGLIRDDGTVPFAAAQSMGGFALTDLADGIDPQDAATVAQLAALSAIYGDLNAVFLALAGGTMSGAIDMSNNKLTGVPDPVDALDAVNKQTLDASVQAVTDASLALEGTKASVPRGTLTGPVTLGAAATDNADADQTTDPPAVTVHTLHGVPRPTAADQVANLQVVNEEIAELETRLTQDEDYTGTGEDGTGSAPNLTAGGVYNYTSLTVSGTPQTITGPLRIFCSGNVSISTALTVSTGRLEILADGNITVSAALIASAGAITLKALGNVVVNAAVTASDRVVVEGATSVSVAAALTGESIRVHSSAGTVTATGTHTASRVSAAAGDVEFYGQAGTEPGGGSAGALGGGAGGAPENPGGAGGAAAKTKGGHYIYQWPIRNGASGAAGTLSAVGGNGGGTQDWYAAGDLVLTGAVILADGANGTGNGTPQQWGGGGGGGGTVRCGCKGTLTDGSFGAAGGDGGDGDLSLGNGGDGGGGGGGGAFLVASAYSGTQTTDVTGGNSTNGTDGSAGTVETVTLPAEDIQYLYENGVFDAAEV